MNPIKKTFTYGSQQVTFETGDIAQPWPATPTLHYPAAGTQVRILCGYVQCQATGFAPFRAALPEFIHIRTSGQEDWLAGTIAQIVTEVDSPNPAAARYWNG